MRIVFGAVTTRSVFRDCLSTFLTLRSLLSPYLALSQAVKGTPPNPNPCIYELKAEIILVMRGDPTHQIQIDSHSHRTMSKAGVVCGGGRSLAKAGSPFVFVGIRVIDARTNYDICLCLCLSWFSFKLAGLCNLIPSV